MELTSGGLDITSAVEVVVTVLELISVTILAVGVAFVLGRAGYRALRGSRWEQIHEPG